MRSGWRFFWTGLIYRFLSVGALLVSSLDVAYADPPPNVVVFLADDMGWTDWQFDATLNPTGSMLYETPNLLRLAQQSVSFTDAYATAPLCSPTRASILTGKSPARTRITNIIPSTPNTSATLKEPLIQTFLPGPVAQPNFVNSLKNNGYTTGLFGKWHLGNAGPTNYGFDVNVGGTWFGGPGDGAGGWFAGSDGMWAGLPGLDTPGQYPADKYLSDAISEKVGDFVQQHAGQPFVIANWEYQVHTPLQAPANLITKYQNKIALLQGQGVDLKGHTNAIYAAMMEKMDQDLGASPRSAR